MGLLFMPHKRPNWKALKIDWHAFAFLSVAMLCLFWILGNGQRFGWVSEKIIIATMVCLVCATAFAVLQITSKHPLIELSLLRNPQFIGSVLVNVLFGAGFSVTTLYIPLFVQEIQGYSATRAGVIMMPAGFIMVFVTLLAGRLADLIRERFIIFTGFIIMSLGSVLMFGADVNSPFWTVATFAIIGRIGIGLIMPVIDKVSLQCVPAGSVGRASSVVSFFRQGMGATAMGLATVIVEIRTHAHIDTLTATQTAANSATRDYIELMKRLLTASGLPDSLRESVALDHLGKAIAAQASAMGYQEMFLAFGLFVVLGLIPTWIASHRHA
jgi:MFS family permease